MVEGEDRCFGEREDVERGRGNLGPSGRIYRSPRQGLNQLGVEKKRMMLAEERSNDPILLLGWVRFGFLESGESDLVTYKTFNSCDVVLYAVGGLVIAPASSTRQSTGSLDS